LWGTSRAWPERYGPEASTDTVNTAAFAVHQLLAEGADPLSLIERALAEGHVIPGTAPQFMDMLLRTDEALLSLVRDPQVITPWLWSLDEHRSLLTYAVRFQRRVP
jgi:hypothetical protein